MAKFQKAEQLRQKLLARGYSYSYINRLIAELDDHRSAIIENSFSNQFDDPSVSTETEEQLGVHSAFIDSLEHYPELKPWPQRHPLWMFVVFPGVALCLLTALTISTGEIVARGELIENDSVNRFALQNHWLTTLAVFSAAASFFAWIAIRCRVPWTFLVAALSLISLNGLFVTELGACRQNDSAIAYSHFGFDFWRMMLPLGICLLGVFVARRQHLPAVEPIGPQSRFRRESHPLLKPSAALGPLTSAPVLAVLVVATFFFSATQTAKRVKQHRADKFIPGMLSEMRNAYDTLDLLKFDTVVADLGVSQKEKLAFKATIKGWEQFQITESARHLSNPPSMSEYRSFESKIIKPKLLEIEQSLLNRLSGKQKARLQEIRYQYIENDLYFLPTVQTELCLSATQLKSVKDFYIERFRRDARLHRDLYRGDQSAADKLIESRQQHDSHVAALLNQPQRQKLQEMLGRPIDFTVAETPEMELSNSPPARSDQ